MYEAAVGSLGALVSDVGEASLLLWLPGSLLLHGVGYVLSTFITLGLLAGFKRQDLRARQSPFYAPRSNLGPISVAVTILAVARSDGPRLGHHHVLGGLRCDGC
jgi:hypothetical protein